VTDGQLAGLLAVGVFVLGVFGLRAYRLHRFRRVLQELAERYGLQNS
jgi:hypothetical protein